MSRKIAAIGGFALLILIVLYVVCSVGKNDWKYLPQEECYDASGNIVTTANCELDSEDNLINCYNSKGNFDGKRVEIKHYDNGELEVHRNYEDGEFNGKGIDYFNGQILYEAYFKNGESYKEIHYSGGQIMYERNYKNGEKDGKQIGYYENGQIEWEEKYKNGKLDGKWVAYYENGQISEKKYFKKGELNGKAIEYFENGQVKSKRNYKNGEKDGKQIGYYENGQIMYERNYKNGIYDGKQIKYYENGQIESESIEKNGRVVQSKYYDENGNEV